MYVLVWVEVKITFETRKSEGIGVCWVGLLGLAPDEGGLRKRHHDWLWITG